MRTKNVNKFKKASSKLAFLFACAIVVSPCITSLQSCKATSEEIHSEIISSSSSNEVKLARSNKTMKQANRVTTKTYGLVSESETTAVFTYKLIDYRGDFYNGNNYVSEYIYGTLAVWLDIKTFEYNSITLNYYGWSVYADDDFHFSYEFDNNDLQMFVDKELLNVETILNFTGGEYDYSRSEFYLNATDELYFSSIIEHREEFYFATLNQDILVNLYGKLDLAPAYEEIEKYIAYKSNFDTIYENAYVEGFQAGKIASGTTFQDGYSKGFMDAKNQYQNVEAISFEDVLTAIITAPNKIIREGFDFDILGINVGSLIQTCIVIGLIVFCIGVFKKG